MSPTKRDVMQKMLSFVGSTTPMKYHLEWYILDRVVD